MTNPKLKNEKEIRERGNALFRKSSFEEAIVQYEQALALDPLSILSASNSAQAALYLGDFTRALDFAERALKIDPLHQKSWFRKVKSLAGLKRVTEAHCWVADLVKSHPDVVEDATRMKLHVVISECTKRTCYGFEEGLVVERVAADYYRVITLKPVKKHTFVSKELAILPWCCEDIYNTDRLRRFLSSSIAQKDMVQIKGMMPRIDSSIPQKVASLSELPARIRSMKPNASEADITNWLRVLSCAKLNAHDDGIHQFGVFYNHSCFNNCEVRGSRHLEVMTLVDLKVGDELTISYLSADHLDGPADISRLLFEKGWRVKSNCTRCNNEMQSYLYPDELAAEARYMSEQQVMVTKFNNCPIKKRSNLLANPCFSDTWKQVWLLKHLVEGSENNISLIMGLYNVD
eukprot:Pgem_evm1s18291